MFLKNYLQKYFLCPHGAQHCCYVLSRTGNIVRQGAMLPPQRVLVLPGPKTRTHCGGNVVSCDVAKRGNIILRTARTQETFREDFQKNFMCPWHKICVGHKCCARGKTSQHLGNMITSQCVLVLTQRRILVAAALCSLVQVKTTSPESYRVRPSSGMVAPSATAEVSVYLQPGNQKAWRVVTQARFPLLESWSLGVNVGALPASSSCHYDVRMTKGFGRAQLYFAITVESSQKHHCNQEHVHETLTQGIPKGRTCPE